MPTPCRAARSCLAPCQDPRRATAHAASAAAASAAAASAAAAALPAALRVGLTRAPCRVPRAEGAIDAKTIAEHQLVDNHYHAIASKARAPGFFGCQLSCSYGP